jgi:spore germination protein GerM
VKRLAIILSVLAVVLAACGTGADVGDAGGVTTSVQPTTAPSTTVPTTTTAPPGGSTTTTIPTSTTLPPQETRFVDVYFVKDGRYATSIARAVPATTDVAANAIRALIAGPTAAETDAGLSSAVPSDTLLLGIAIHDGLATIDLSREFEAGGGTFSMTARLGQVVYTLSQFPTIDRVEFRLDGEPVTVFSSEGLLLEEPVSRTDYLAALPLTPTLPDDVVRWEQADMPDLGDFPAADTRRVVLVAEDDVLNVRIGPGVGNEIIGSLAPGVIVALTGPREQVGSSTWVEIVTPAGAGWVNDLYLAAVVTDQAFASDSEVKALLDEMSAIMAAHGDLSTVTSTRGLYVSHNTAPIRFTPDELRTVLADATTYKWPSGALDPNDPEQLAELPDRTFAQAIGDRFVSAYADSDTELAYDDVLAGGNARIPEYAIPFELKGFHYVAVYDPGDNPDYGGLDWTTWYVSIDYEDGHPVVVGMTLDEWVP